MLTHTVQIEGEKTSGRKQGLTAIRTGAVMQEKPEELLLSRIEVVGMREEDARKGKEERGCKQPWKVLIE
jgi:hypothetical protein